MTTHIQFIASRKSQLTGTTLRYSRAVKIMGDVNSDSYPEEQHPVSKLGLDVVRYKP